MDIKELNQSIPSDLKVKIKNFLSKFDLVQPVAAPVAPVAVAPVTPAATFGEGLLADGVTVIKYSGDTLAEGSTVTVITPEGEMNAPEGEHTLQDGTVITVAVEGGVSIVKSVTPVAPVAPAAPSEDMANVLAQVTGFSSQLEKFASKEEMISKFEAQENEIKELKLKVSEFVHLFVSVLELPSAAPIEQPRNKFDKTNKIINKLQKIN